MRVLRGAKAIGGGGEISSHEAIRVSLANTVSARMIEEMDALTSSS